MFLVQKAKIKSKVGRWKLIVPLCKSDPDLNIASFRNVKSNEMLDKWIETNMYSPNAFSIPILLFLLSLFNWGLDANNIRMVIERSSVFDLILSNRMEWTVEQVWEEDKKVAQIFWSKLSPKTFGLLRFSRNPPLSKWMIRKMQNGQFRWWGPLLSQMLE